jgi:hypothetical protein
MGLRVLGLAAEAAVVLAAVAALTLWRRFGRFS